MSELGWRERVCNEWKILNIAASYSRTTCSAPGAQHHSRGVSRGMFVVGGEGVWIGATRGRMVVYTESRGWRGPRACGRGARVAGCDGRGWCRWSRRRCSLHEPSPLSCARESVLADHCRRKDGQTGPCFIVVVFVVVVVLVFDIYYRAVHVGKVFSAIRAQSNKIIIYVICTSGEPSVRYWCWWCFRIRRLLQSIRSP